MEAFIGTVMMFAGNFAPRGWMFCQGQLLPISQYSALFSLLGTTYGGNGQTTFGLPDLRSRVPVGMGQGPGLSPRTQGQMGGTETSTALGTAQFALRVENLPTHTHPINGGVEIAVADQVGTTNLATGNVLAKRVLDPSKAPPTAINGYVDLATANFTPTNKLGGVMNNLTVGNTGGGQPVSAQVSANVPIMEPYLVMNYIICTEGIFPSRQ